MHTGLLIYEGERVRRFEESVGVRFARSHAHTQTIRTSTCDIVSNLSHTYRMCGYNTKQCEAGDYNKANRTTGPNNYVYS